MIIEKIKEIKNYEKLTDSYNLLDLTGVKSVNYGFILFNEIVIPKAQNIVKIEEFNNHYCLDFVYEDFRRLYEKLQKDSYKNFIPIDSMFNINKFEIIKSYIPPLKLFKNNLKFIYESFKLFNNKKQINSFQEFLKQFEIFVLYTNQILTFSSFLKSKKCSLYSSGLAIKFTEKTNEEILKDSSFEYFNNMCNLHNFFLEKNDLSKMIYILKDDTILLDKYNFIYEFDILIFINSIFTIYDYYYNDYLLNKQTNEKKITTKQILNLFVLSKLRETQKSWNKSTIDQTLKELYFIMEHKDVPFVTRMIHRLTNVTDNKDITLINY